MTSCKTAANLTAIYNLKFYRKQNCWKLNSPISKEREQKEKLSTSLRTKLNDTYIITDKVRDESPEIEPLNVAFFESEKEQEICDSKHPLSQQWLEPVNIWPATITKSEPNVNTIMSIEEENQQSNKKKACIHERLEVLLKAAKEHEDAKSEPALGDIARQNIPESYDFNIEEEYIGHNCMPPDLQQTVRSEPWINPVNVWLDRDVIDGLHQKQGRPGGDWDNASHPSQNLASHAFFHPPSTVSLNADADSTCSSDFMHGAHNAPHSSEIEISLPPGFTIETLSPNILQNLMNSKMNVRLFTQKKKPERSFTSDVGSYDEYPTRDVGLLPLDEFVAGSNLGLYRRVDHNQLGGRGRGRLVQNYQRY
ncbi:uncharacterized protein LOC121739902 [Aricia agestis]|uniref:uncharacterized protein LOC121739902 n=1 Tax=Aricia agestis TaxID=91739 RepID=UPI001C202FBD|nr:uncharacterized protein LOC121739902 [Aricia agestis]